MLQRGLSAERVERQMPKKILVVGGTGMLGRPVVDRLAAAGSAVRVMTRQADRAEGRFAPGIETLEGDPFAVSAIRRALEGCDGIYLNLPGGAEAPIASAAAEAARLEGLARIASISGATVAEENRWFPPTEGKLNAEQAIRACGIPHTIFRPSWFMESLPRFVVKGRAAVFGRQPHPFRWVAADDYARMVTAAFGTDACANKTLFVLGPEPLRMHEALRRYCEAAHPEIQKVSTVPIWFVKALAFVTRNHALGAVARLMGYFEKVQEKGDPTEANALLGAPTTTLGEWIAAHRH
jgi:uncharacterized protein YbjT (DUF2867 family)